jgi:predicted HTH transcriptional regulator
MKDEWTGTPINIAIDVASPMIDFSDAELISRLNNFEDHFVERKSARDSRDWLKTAVALANSVPIGYPAILFANVKDNGTIETGLNLDILQRSFSRVLSDAYPPVYYTAKVFSCSAPR